MEIVSNAFYLIANFVYELLLFAVVDGVVKFLQNTRSVEAKEMIWKLECVVLFGIVIYVWCTYHMPYFLMLMLMLAVWSTQTSVTGNIRRWWLLVLARWEEFEQHEESMGHMQQQQFSDSEVNSVVKPRPPLSTHQDNSTTAELGQRPSHVQRRPALPGSVVTSYASAPVETNSGVSVGRGQHWLKHLTNRAHVAISCVLGQSVRRYDDVRPPGLRNPSQNVCFLNAVMQAIAHTPCLPEAVIQLRKSNPQDLLMWHLSDLLDQLAAPVSTNVPLVLDTSNFRTQASVECVGGLIQRPFDVQQQRQQDVAECLTWMLEWLHARMNSACATDKSSGVSEQQRNGLSPDCSPHRTYSTMIVSRLMHKYGRQSRQMTADQRSAAVTQIESSDGMNTALYIGSVNVVSQIDWFWHCCAHSSPVHELFAGQLVDLRLCDSCRRVAVSTQLFHILPVPVAEPSLLHGLVSLDACLQQFARIEQLGGANGLLCEHCNRLRCVRPDPVVSLTVMPVGNHVVPLSPIYSSTGGGGGGGGGSGVLNDSVVHHRTSTPVQCRAASLLTDCRRRSLVGHLPSCLVIQLMRFVVDAAQQSVKLSLPVSLPLSGLDMSPYVLHNVDPTQAGLCDRTTDQYNLYALCVHVGSDSTTNGHYITYARCHGDTWYCFDDEHVRAVNMNYELTTRLVRENAYLLFYERAFDV